MKASPDYIVVRHYYLNTMEDKVAEKMKEGYIPTGGLVICLQDSSDRFYQSMYRPTAKPKTPRKSITLTKKEPT